ncbi:MAG TPA: hypothetical protein VKO87_04090 [Gemmatimonadaceae bacterium]|nr:hypothetical protein [Gemmatimonadaceae bacterium]
MNRLVRTSIAAACIAASAGVLHAQSVPSVPVNPLLEKVMGDWRMAGQVRGKPATYDPVSRHLRLSASRSKLVVPPRSE